MMTTDLARLQGATVLVRSTLDRRNPPAARRGSIQIVDTDQEAPPRVEIVLEFPEMFSKPAHQRAIVLSEESLASLLATEKSGAFEFTIDEKLD
jgi:hypothetical protein